MATKLHEMGEAWFDATTLEVAFCCLDCRALVRGRAEMGVDGHTALATIRLLHANITEQRPQIPTRIEVHGGTHD